jgi:putative ABC transport system permease protein
VVDLAFKTLWYDKPRFGITVAGVAFAVTLVLVQVGLFFGLLDNATVTIDHMPADLWVTPHNTPNIDFAQTFAETNVYRVRSVPGVARADNLTVAFIPINLPNGAKESTLCYAMEDFRRWGFPWDVIEGNLEQLTEGPYLLLDESSRRRFGPFATGQYREMLGQRFKIIGKTRGARSFTTTPVCFVDTKWVQDIVPEQRNKASYIVAKLAPGLDPQAVKAEIRRRLPFNDVYTREEWSRRSRNYWVVSTGLGLNISVTVVLGILVGIVVVAQTLYASTMEHLKEYGTVKAIGGSNWDIYQILFRQAGIAAVVGFVLALGPSFAMAPVMARLDLKLIISPVLLGIVFVATIAFCLASAAFSFRKVAGIDPAIVFRG